MPLNPILEHVLGEMAAANAPAMIDMPPVEARLMYLAMQEGASKAEVAEVENRIVEDIAIRIYRPIKDKVLPCLVYFHGGGWVIGDLDTHDSLCRLLAQESQCIIISVDYRLAPEHPFPAPFDDCYRVTRWVIDNKSDLKVSDIALGGDSAGGNLATCVCLKLRDESTNEEQNAIAHQLLIYPVTDALMDTRSYKENAEGYLLTEASMAWFWQHYLGDQDKKNPYISPLHATSLSDLPSATVLTAEYDPLRDEGEAYAAQLEKAGIKVKLKRYDGLIHGFVTMSDILPEALDAIKLLSSELKLAFNERR